MPAMYQDLWTAAKGVYKTEPAIADGGEVVVYAPHVREASHVHGHVIDQIGYHCRDYFLAQWDRFGGYPLGILAHSTHVKGPGTYDAGSRVEAPRIKVTLATGIPREQCEHLSLDYRDPADVDQADWSTDMNSGAYKVPRAGELLFRVGKPPDARGNDVKYAMGVVGLGVMGANLARNIESRGFPVVGYDLDAAKAQAFVNGPAKGKAVAAADSPANLMVMLERPRRILVMVPAGKPVDSVIAHLKPHLEAGDILIDGGNSFFVDTDRRSDELASGGFHFVGAGVSGRRGRRASRASDHAGRPARGVGRALPHPPRHRGKGRRRRAVRRLHGPARGRALRQDGAQRDRVRRHAAHRRDLRPAAVVAAVCLRRRSPTSSRSGTRPSSART